MINKLINIALAEVGYLEKRSADKLDSKTDNAGSKNFTKYARDMCKCHAGIYANGYAWCDTFVDWCMVQAFGADKTLELIHGWSAYTPTSAGYYKIHRQWHTTPQKGDQIFFKDSSGTICHTGIVYDIDANYVYTVEGNTSTQSGIIANDIDVHWSTLLDTESVVSLAVTAGDFIISSNNPSGVEIGEPFTKTIIVSAESLAILKATEFLPPEDADYPTGMSCYDILTIAKGWLVEG